MEIIQVVGYKDSGKTTLVRELVNAFTQAGYNIGTLKNSPHDHDPEPEGTDTRLHREAGAAITAFVTPNRAAWVEERKVTTEEIVETMARRGVDILIVEGFKNAPYPKIALIRSETDTALIDLPNTITVATRTPISSIDAAAESRGIARFHVPDTASFGPITAFWLDRVRSNRKAK
ncbi:molybdopterin-guanine dinucleotide biosynthesis protein B [Cohnella soli]|uniref:Molybdopterin-guanine dinucleotide biosynthesis protein B n=1 Tax=Cohnella soli TaxID=425005 RepID=A0ABW0HY16_9BACL